MSLMNWSLGHALILEGVALEIHSLAIFRLYQPLRARNW